jgi:hypothetical protein
MENNDHLLFILEAAINWLYNRAALWVMQDKNLVDEIRLMYVQADKLL